MVCGGLVVVGANMAGQRNKYAFKFLLHLLILSQKYILGVKKVVWDGLEVVWGGLEVVWRWFGGGLGLTWQVYVIKMLLNSFFKSSYYHKNIYWVLRKWFGVV